MSGIIAPKQRKMIRRGLKQIHGKPLTTKEFGEIFNLPDHVEAEELQMETDRAYFEKHPEKDWYIRPLIPGEAPVSESHVKVIHIVPGLRQRLFFDLEFAPLGICQQRRGEA